MGPGEKEDRQIALECASRIHHKGDIRRVLQDAELFISWLNNDTVDIVEKITDRFPSG